LPNDAHLAQNHDNMQEKNINRKYKSKYIETQRAVRGAAGCRGLEFVYKSLLVSCRRRFLFDGALSRVSMRVLVAQDGGCGSM
jgi:hypothetical protein